MSPPTVASVGQGIRYVQFAFRPRAIRKMYHILMELRQLACFVTVAEESSFRRAAERLHISQPHVTRVIHALEEDLGAPLFMRKRRGICLTPAGLDLLDGARDLLARAHAVSMKAQRAAVGEVGTLALAFVSTAGVALMPPLVRAFRARYPDVNISLVPMTTVEQLRALSEERIEIGLLRMLVDEPGLERRIICEEHLYAIVPDIHPYADRASIHMRDLRGEPLIVYPRADGPAIYDRIIGHCRDAGFEPNIVQECGHNQGLTGLVAAGVGVALAIGTPLSLAGNGVRVLRLTGDIPSWPLSLAWRVGRESATATAFLRVAGEMQF